jgi:hypothetical protein
MINFSLISLYIKITKYYFLIDENIELLGDYCIYMQCNVSQMTHGSVPSQWHALCTYQGYDTALPPIVVVLYVMSTKKRYAVNLNYPCFSPWLNE